MRSNRLNIREFPIVSVRSDLRRLWDISNIALVVWPIGIRLDLSLEDEEVKRELVKRGSSTYSELVRLDILVRLIPSSPSVMKPSHGGPHIVKPTREELQARVEALSRKMRSVKRKSQASPKRSLLA